MVTFPKEVILEYITKYITSDYKDNDEWININSVFVHDSKHRMGFNIEKNFVHDFKLGQTWNLTDFIKEYENLPTDVLARNKLMQILIKFKKGKISFSPTIPKIVKPVELQEVSKEIFPPVKEFDKNVLRSKVGRRAWKFLINREIEPKHIKKYNLMYSDEKDCWVCKGMKEICGEKCQNCKGTGKNFYYNRIIIPTYENGNLVYFQGRDLSEDSNIRYMNPKLPRLQVVYFYDNIQPNSRIYITEGPFDAMTLFDESATCLLGNSISDPQIFKLLDKNPKEIIFVPDYDETKTKRENIAKAMLRNIDKIKKLSDKELPIGIYQWYKKYDKTKKDINAARVKTVDEDLIHWINNSFKESVMERLKSV